MAETSEAQTCPAASGRPAGPGSLGIFDGIGLPRILRWRPVVSSAGYPPSALASLGIGTVCDGLRRAAACVLVAAGPGGGRAPGRRAAR